MIIAVDGTSGSGKGTVSRKLAAHLDYAYLDTGGLYRAVGLSCLRAGVNFEDEAGAAKIAGSLDLSLLESPDIRTDTAADAASRTSGHPAVRQALLELQRGFAANPPEGKKGAILDGRDIGTVVCPEAPKKLYVTASVEARAMRRYKELIDRGERSIYARVLADLEARDARDMGRAAAPLKKAEGSMLLDTTEMTPDEAFEAALAFIES